MNELERQMKALGIDKPVEENQEIVYRALVAHCKKHKRIPRFRELVKYCGGLTYAQVRRSFQQLEEGGRIIHVGGKYSGLYVPKVV